MVERQKQMLEEERERQKRHQSSTSESSSMWAIASDNPDFIVPEVHLAKPFCGTAEYQAKLFLSRCQKILGLRLGRK